MLGHRVSLACMAADIFDVDFLDAAAPAPEVVAVPAAEAIVDSDDDVEAIPHFSPGAPPALKLYTVGGKQRLEHALTGEVFEMPDGSDWKLTAGDGVFGFLAAAGRDPVWASDVLHTTVWRCNDGIYFQTRGPEEMLSAQWLEDIKAKSTAKYIWWGAICCAWARCEIDGTQFVRSP